MSDVVVHARQPAAGRRPRAVRRHRRPRQAQAVPGAVPARAARRAEGPGHRRRPQRLDRRRLPRARPRVGRGQRRGHDEAVHRRHVRAARPHPGRLRATRRRGSRSPTRSTSHGSQVAVFYMAIPPDMFPTVAETLASVGLNERGRIVVEKPFGRDLESALELNRHAARGLPRGAHLPHRPLPRQGGRRGPAGVPLLQHAARAGVEPQLRAQRADHDGRDDRRRGPRQLLRRRRRDPRRRAEPPAAGRVRCWRWSRRSDPTPSFLQDEKAKVLAAMRADRSAVPRARPVRRLPRRAGRRRRTRPSRRTSPRGCEIDSWRWAGVPWYVRVRQGAAARRRPRPSSSSASRRSCCSTRPAGRRPAAT